MGVKNVAVVGSKIVGSLRWHKSYKRLDRSQVIGF